MCGIWGCLYVCIWLELNNKVISVSGSPRGENRLQSVEISRLFAVLRKVELRW